MIQNIIPIFNVEYSVLQSATDSFLEYDDDCRWVLLKLRLVLIPSLRLPLPQHEKS
jgi:hypothetical protein